jgi:16S rRNA (guanine527-N7)-methyltransferase
MIQPPLTPGFQENLKPEEGRSWVEQGAKALGISILEHQIDQFIDYLRLLQKWNRVINLTGIHSWRDIIVKHFLDSLTLLPHLPMESSILDLGSGAGFPGLPIKVVRPTQEMTLIEASAKKVSFLKEVVRHLGLRDIRILQGFLNKKSPDLFAQKPFDIITTRAVGIFPGVLAVAQGLLSSGGRLILMKGSKGFQELTAMEAVIQKMGFQIEAPIFLTLPILNQERILIFLRKI